jgi:hypothetical protein
MPQKTSTVLKRPPPPDAARAHSPIPPQLEGFRRPNFPLVAELLYWLVAR